MYQMLQYRSKWKPVFTDNIALKYRYENNLIMNSINTKTWVYPDSVVTTAKDKGLIDFSILLRYNEWEIGKNSVRDLERIVAKSIGKDKIVTFMHIIDDDSVVIKELKLPKGIVGIRFSYPTERSDIQYAYSKYEHWKHTNNIVN